jgi:hypothetical protein
MASRLLFLCARGSSRALLAASIIEPAFGMQWDEGIVLCSGASGT